LLRKRIAKNGVVEEYERKRPLGSCRNRWKYKAKIDA
jgi:hypothetical protein